MIVFAAFIVLVSLTATKADIRNAWRGKNGADWLLDGAGLFCQGILIPLLQLTIVYQLYQYLFPAYAGSLHWHPVGAFLASFVLVDYIYYWNHRLLHSRYLWLVHRVHHTMTTRDVVGTSRNTLWASFLIVYLWVHGLFLYLLANPSYYALGVSLTAALDLWRHSQIEWPENWLFRWLGRFLILPQDHAWHHAPGDDCNFGANFKWWDMLHGTYRESAESPDVLGIPVPLNLMQMLFWPLP